MEQRDARPVISVIRFLQTPYIKLTLFLQGTNRVYKLLKKEAVPSIFSWSQESSAKAEARQQRTNKRAEKMMREPDIHECFNEEVVSLSVDRPDEVLQTGEAEDPKDAETQTPSRAKLDLSDLMFNPEAMHFYTGLTDYDRFSTILSTLGPGASHLKYRWGSKPSTSVDNQFLVTLIKLRRHTTNYELGFWFNISAYSVGNIFVTWINFMYRQWKRINIWPTRELVSFFMPKDFKNQFPSTRVTIDGMEIPIKKPGKPSAQQVTYSSYKNRNTLKTIVGITPGGLVCHVSAAYGGSASDRILVQRSNLLQKCDPKDSVMADKGFNIQDMAAPYDVKVNIPTFVKKMNQLPPRKLKEDRRISSKRTHVERVIGLGKTHRILMEPLNDVETILGSQIVFVCFMLCNFRPCIVPKSA